MNPIAWIVVIFLIIAAFPAWPYSHDWGYYPSGGLGLVPGANFGHECAIFEAVHGSAPDIAGKGLANPTALMQSARLMLAHLGERDAAVRLQKAIETVYAEGKHLTHDTGGTAGTEEFTEAVIGKL